MTPANDNQRLLSRKDAAAYCGVSVATFSAWVTAGFMPKPLFASKRWDKKAIDAAIDKESGLAQPVAGNDNETALQKFLREAQCG